MPEEKKEVVTIFHLLDHASHVAHKMAEKMERLHERAERAKGYHPTAQAQVACRS